MTIKTNALKSIAIAVTLSCSAISLSATAHDTHAHEANANNSVSSKALANAVAGDHRTAKNKARDQYRHPIETLNFFGFTPTMTVVEITPGGGWYTEILAPALKGTGKLYGAHYPDTGEDDYYSNSRKKLVKKLASDVVFSEVVLTDFTPRQESELAPQGTADLILTFRNLHNWKDAGVEQVFKDAFNALKPGGVLGVVEHRLPAGADAEKAGGYVSEAKTIKQAKAAGFRFVASSEINANPKDLAQYTVWTLPPSLALGEKDRAKYLAIGESDRMTLKFVKPAK
ncbi:methyltransferase [Colwellia sp. MT41]|uniref:Methyltransferase n=1 Tax=Colwellia marinimaniae TaxID=1513592 RepID=A0ABQ0MZK5_9GAMM|nr:MULTISPECIES: class I SAM-dependent methyltransferase [Colwellia]ALO33649.1 methyltransferase [Colwellia sp. MT41]GAW97806.1 methyltransferase [Colwellia marinimaniae]